MTDEEIIELANRFTKDRGDPNNYLCLYEDGELQQFARAIAAKERERCAKICEDHFMSDGDWCAHVIRSEG